MTAPDSAAADDAPAAPPTHAVSPASPSPQRLHAEQLDADDPLAPWRDEFIVPDPEVIYLDGNSLGRTPRRALDVAHDVVGEQWADGLIRSWFDPDHPDGGWLDLPLIAGDELAPVIGAAPGEVIVDDSTTVNLFKLINAALDAPVDPSSPHSDGSRPPTIAVDAHEFPTDRYTAEGIAEVRGGSVRYGTDDLDGVDVVVRSMVDYRTAQIADVRAETERATSCGARTVWDLSHAAGVLALDVHELGIEFAAGCTYKFLNAGPGAPAFAYIDAALHDGMRPALRGWFGQRNQFAMDDGFAPRPGIAALLSGTPAVLATQVARAGITMTRDAGIERIEAKARALGDLAVAVADDLGLTLASPRSTRQRGGHVAIRHPRAAELHQLLEQRKIIVDKREPDILRLGLSPLTTKFTDVHDALTALAELAAGMLEP